MDYNERIFLTLSAGTPVAVDAADKEAICRAVRRRLQQQQSGLKALGLTSAKKTLRTALNKDGTYTLTLTERRCPAFTILQETGDDADGNSGS